MTSEEDPFSKLVETLAVLENYDRALCLIAVYLGQRADQNTVQGITDIFSALLGKETEATPAKVRRLITYLINVNILERESVKMISSTKVSFHSISHLGLIALLYILIMYIIKDPMHGVEWDKLMFVGYISGDREDNLVRFLNNSLIESNKITEKFWTSLKSGKEPKTIRMSKPLDLDINKTFSGKGGIDTFKILEEILWDHLNLNIGISKDDIASHFESSITSNLNKLSPLILVEQLDKTQFYRLSSLGVFILPVIALMIKQLSIDQSIFQSFLTKNVNTEEHPWVVLIRQARLFFKNLYRIT
ncbi:MAG: hypothetical protein ACFFB2_12230 [Promethearchaeota archaeon]